MKRNSAIGLGLLAAGVGAAAILTLNASKASGTSPPPNVALSSTQWKNPVSATMYAFGGLTVSDTAANVGLAIASLNPSYVEGLVRVEGPSGNANGQLPLSPQILADVDTVMSLVHAVNPNAVYGMRIRTTQYPTSAALTTGIQQLLAQVRPDVLFFDSMDGVVIGGVDVSAEYQAAAVDACHAAAVLAEFDVASKGVFGPVTTLPEAFSCSDWPHLAGGGPVSIVDVGFMLGPFMAQLSAAANGNDLPLMLHVNNSATPVDAFGNPERAQFGNESLPAGQVMTTAQRQAFYTTGAQLQAANGYALMYGVIAPTITVGPPSIDFYAPFDDGMMSTLLSLSLQYNF